MAATAGSLDAQGCPHVAIRIFPEGASASAKEFDAIIDTGFTGFAQMPVAAAEAAALFPVGEMDLTYPDGTTVPTPVVWTSVQLGAEMREGFTFLAQGSDEILVGVHFLRVFDKTLIFSVTGERVLLTDEA